MYLNKILFIFQESIPGWTDAEVASSRRPEEWRLQRAAIAHLPAIAAFSAGHLHNLSGHSMAVDADVLHAKLSPVLAGFRGDLVANSLHPR